MNNGEKYVVSLDSELKQKFIATGGNLDDLYINVQNTLTNEKIFENTFLDLKELASDISKYYYKDA